MGPYGDPLPNGALNALFPMRLVAVPEAALQGPLLFNRAMQLWMTPAGALIAAGAESGSGYAGAGLVMLGLAYAPLGALGGAIHGAVAEARWKPCDERLRAHLARVRPADALQGRLREVLGTTHANFDPRPGPQPGQAEGGTRTVLWVEITSTALWPGDAGLVTEVAIRARLWDVAARQWAYDRSFVSSPNVAARLLRPYETPFDAASSGRSVTDYCAADGPESFVREIERAADAALAEMIADLQLQAPR
jgi:hypothetical protein